MLFLRIAEELGSKNLAETYLIDYLDGFMSKNMNTNFSKLVEYSDQKDLRIPDEAIIIFQSMTPWSIFPRLKIGSGTKLFFWNCYPFNLVPLLPGLRRIMQRNPSLSRFLFSTILSRYRKVMVDFTNLLISGNSLVFQDKVNVDVTKEYLNIEIDNPHFLPVPSSAPKSIKRPEPDILKEGLRVVWVGRIVDFKYYTLIRFLEDINKIKNQFNFPITITLIGQGDHLALLKRETSKLENLSINFINGIETANLDNFLINEADMLIAMGTSVLEGAKLGIPTLLLDIAHKAVPEGYNYQWFHEREDFVLADVLRESDINPGNESLNKVINGVISDYEVLSKKSLQHFQLNHSVQEIAKKTLDLSLKARITWSQLDDKGFLKRGFVYSTFSFLKKILKYLGV